VKANLAAYKAPKSVIVVDSLGRSPAGKLDYPGLKEQAIAQLGGG
jgi:fatty-acyl-CoA synthase